MKSTENSELRLLAAVRESLADGQGRDAVEIAASESSGGLFAWMIVVTATSRRHAAAMGDRVIRAVRSSGFGSPSVEGRRSDDWMLIDAGAVVVNIMLAEARAHYDLESLWKFPRQKSSGGE